jgi:hypothetical protein
MLEEDGRVEVRVGAGQKKKGGSSRWCNQLPKPREPQTHAF